jgi:thiamine pyrophosphokinase
MVTRVIVLAGGSGPLRSELDAAWPGWDEAIEAIIGADAGALLARPLGLRLDLVVGDGDSLGDSGLAELGRAGVAIDRWPTDKDASDTELALVAAAGRGATDVLVLGAFGGRLDHQLANIWILAHPVLAGRKVTLLDGRTRVRLLSASEGPVAGVGARFDLIERAGDLVTLLPFDGPATDVTTHGLRWPLVGATLATGYSRGLSNEVVATSGRPRVELGGGRLLVIETTLLGSGS